MSNGDAVARNDEGVRLLHAGDYEGAVAAFTEALAMDPDFETAYRNRASAFEIQKRLGARKRVKTARARSRHKPEGSSTLFWVLFGLPFLTGGSLALFGFLGIFIDLALSIVWSEIPGGPPIGYSIGDRCGPLVWFGCSVWSLVWIVVGIAFFQWIWYEEWQADRLFKNTAVTTNGTVQVRRFKEVSDGYGGKDTIYYLTVSFRPNQADQMATFEAEVSHDAYDATREGERIKVHYVPSKPEIFLLEGE